MAFKKLMALALGALVSGTSLASAQAPAQESIFVPLFTYRTGPFATSGTPWANGMRDYLTLLNERDGGIGGVKMQVEECETGYIDVAKGVACYESVKARNPVMINALATGITLALIPKAHVDKIPILSMTYGLSASARGDAFPWVFNPPATYWDGLTMILSHIGSEVGGVRQLRGMKIGYIYLDSGYGREPIPLFEQLAKDFGFELQLYSVSPKEMENQSALWAKIKADKRDYMVMYGYGSMNPTAVREAIKVGYPMSRFFSIWWMGEYDMRTAGPGASGFKTLNYHNVGIEFPAMRAIITDVVLKGKSQVKNPNEVGELLYNRGVYNALLISEAIRNAQKITGKKVVVGEDVRRGLEQLNITPQRMNELGFDGFAEPLRLNCEDHNGHRPAYIQQWHGATWLKISGQVMPMKARLQPLIDAAAKDFTEKNAPWPARSEPCDAN